MTGFWKGLLKWALCCSSICILYCIFDTIGLLFAVGLCAVVIMNL